MKKYIGFSIIALGLTLTSCDDWLDKLPEIGRASCRERV